MKTPPRLKTVRWTTAKGVEKVCYYHVGARPERKLTSLGTDYSLALKKWAEIEGFRMRSPKGTLAEAYERYIEWAERSDLKPATLVDYKKRWRQLEKPFGKCITDELKPEWMVKYFDSRSSKIRAKKELKFVSVLCNWSASRGLSNGNNPCANIMRILKVDERRTIYVSDSDYELVKECANQLVKDAMEVCLLFANRPAETAAARLDHIDGKELVVRLPKTEKSGLKEKRIPLTGERLNYVERQRNKAARPLWLVTDEKYQPLKPNGPKFRRAFDEARNKAEELAEKRGIPFQRFQLRDLRAKAATDIARKHGIEAARLMLGHTTQKQTQDYIRSVIGAAENAFNVASGESDRV
jgi:integrase